MSEKSLTRRVLLRLGGALGLVATGVSVAGQASASSPESQPAHPGAFGRPGSGARAKATPDGGSVTNARKGNVASPGSSARGDRLEPATTAIDRTPLSRRAGAKWEVAD